MPTKLYLLEHKESSSPWPLEMLLDAVLGPMAMTENTIVSRERHKT
jgi:hypothetical protein